LGGRPKDVEKDKEVRAMDLKEAIRKEIETAPEPLLREILDFVRFLKVSRVEAIEMAIMSESSLGKDWLRPEEDEAWQDL